MNATPAILRAVASLRNMVAEMDAKRLELGRITKTASILLMAGISRNSIPESIIARCGSEQQSDGGWIGVVDTMWNIHFLRQIDADAHSIRAGRAVEYLNDNGNQHGLWGRSRRDMSRIPVSGMMLSLLPELATLERLRSLEDLWNSERNSLTYKAAYMLMAFRRASYEPRREGLIADTVAWLLENQRQDGSFAPWRDHPVASDVFCTAVAAIGLTQYPALAGESALGKAMAWLLANQLPQGIWPYHEIEDGTSWGVWALTSISRSLRSHT